jgi:hypothetical protein
MIGLVFALAALQCVYVHANIESMVVSGRETTFLELKSEDIAVGGQTYHGRLKVESPGGPLWRNINGQGENE